MTPERIAEAVLAWARLYTRGLPPAVAERRLGELAADLHDHIAHERAAGTDERRNALAVASRAVRGLPADAAWRRHVIARAPTRKDRPKMSPTARSAVRVALVTALVLLVPLIANLTQDGPGWSVPDFVMAAVILGVTGALIEAVVRRPRNLVLRIAAGLIGVTAMVLGEADDAPGLVLFGLLLIGGTLALTVRTVQRSE
jgi:hypothetical protein